MIAAKTSPKAPQDYRDRANEREGQADSAAGPETREILLYLAKRWRDLAAEDEAKEQGKARR